MVKGKYLLKNLNLKEEEKFENFRAFKMNLWKNFNI